MIKPHPFAEEFPMLPPDELVALAKRIKKNGQRRLGTTFEKDGEILLLDGRNREAACEIAGVEFKTKPFKGTEAEALDYVIDMNLTQRHLSAALKAEIGARLATLAAGVHGASADAPTQGEMAAKLGVSRSSITRAKRKDKKPDVTSWTHDELKEDEELSDGFVAINAVYGPDETRAIRTGKIGLKRNEVLQLARMPTQQMKDVRDLIMGSGWAPKKCLEFLAKMPTVDSTNEEMQNWCLAQPEKKIVADIGGFRHTCEKIGAR